MRERGRRKPILTVATADVLMDGGNYADVYREYHCLCPLAGWGTGFGAWAHFDNPKPYNSYGTGAAMRVCPIGWAFSTVVEALLEWRAAQRALTAELAGTLRIFPISGIISERRYRV